MNIKCAHDDVLSITNLREKFHPKNRNEHPADQIKRLADIMSYQGVRWPVKVSTRSGFITAGHGRVLAALENGWDKFPVDYQDYDSEEQEYADLQADNAIASWSELNLSGINADVPDLGPDFDINLLGIKDFVLEPAEKFAPQSDEDEVPEPKESIAKLGDVWTLGNHRLMCGDSTSIDAVEKLMGGEKADMVFTDPPYNQSHSGGGFNDSRPEWTKHRHGILNDFDPQSMFSVISILNPQSGYFFCNKGLLPQYLDWAKSYNGWDLLVMAKNNPIPTKGMKYLSDLEYIVFVRDSGAYFNDQLEYDFYRKFSQISVKGNEFGHPTEKQIKVIDPYLQISSPDQGNVADLFGGSGSTLIACEKTNRKCFMMEIDPHYCDVIIARWEKYTGKKAVLDGQTAA